MAGLYTYHNPLFSGKDKLAEAFIKRNSTPSPFSIVFCTFISAPPQTPVLAEALMLAQASTLTLAFIPVFIPDLLERYTNKDLQRTTKLVLELFVKDQEYNQLQVTSLLCKQLLKAWFFDLYYRNLHLNC